MEGKGIEWIMNLALLMLKVQNCEGKIVLNIAGEEKKKLTVEDLLRKFEVVAGEEFRSDKALLA